MRIMNNKIRTIVHVLPYMAKGGTEKHVLTLCRRQREKYNVVLLAPEGEILPEFRDLGIDHVNFPVLKGNVLKKIDIYKKQLLEIERTYGIDIVHVHAAHEFVRFSRKVLTDTPIVFHLSAHQGSVISKAFNYWQSARIAKKNADLLVAVSEEEKRIVTGKGFPHEKVRVVYNGYELSEGSDKEKITQLKREYGLDGHIVVGNLGRLHNTKRLDILIKAFARLMKESEQELKLLIIGEGPHQRRLEKLAMKEGIEEDVHFTGFIPRGDRVLNVFDIFVLPTTFEGCSNVLVEVMAKGLPIITTNIPSVAWMFEDKKNALLVSQNNVAELYIRLERLVSNENMRRQLGKGAYERFTSEFPAETMVQKIDTIYRELWSQKPA
jgi:glycosyltransferase involved in cell wall biosynthesis